MAVPDTPNATDTEPADQGSLVDRFFERVDGIADPSALLFADGVTEGHFTLSDRTRSVVKDRIRRTSEKSATTTRKLRKGGGLTQTKDEYRKTYEGALNLSDGGFEKLVGWYLDAVQGSSVTLLDSSARNTTAFNEILALPCVDRENSVGLSQYPLKQEAGTNLIAGNIVTLRRKLAALFDFVICINGPFDDHPLNAQTGKNSSMFGTLHALSFLRPGGLYMSNRVLWLSLYTLLEHKIVGEEGRLIDFGHKLDDFPQNAQPQAFKLLRYPDAQEICELLGVENGVYRVKERFVFKSDEPPDY